MTIKKEKAPIYDTIMTTFEGIDPKRVVITYYPNIYYLGNGLLSPDVLHHEKIHLTQQGELGVEKWWDLYLKDENFRLTQEIEAYKAQYTFLYNRVKDRNARAKMLDKLAGDLSGHMYGNILDKNKAMQIIRGKNK